MKYFGICFFLIFSIHPIFSQSKNNNLDELVKELKKASEEDNSIYRLLEYDTILEKYGIKDDTITKETEIFNWTSSSSIDPIDDTKICIFIATAISGKSKYGDDITLIIRGSSDTADLYINWDSYLGNDNSDFRYEKKYVTMRIGNEEAETTLWGNSTDNQSSFYPYDVIELVNYLIKYDKLIVKCTPYGESPITAIFNIIGLKEEILKYNDYLNWIVLE